MSSNSPDRIIFFDGYCVACNKLVDFLLTRDSGGLFCFAALQSNSAEATLPKHGYPVQTIQGIDNVVYLQAGKIKIKSDAILSIMADLGGAYRLFSLLYIVPRFFRNRIYDEFARHRYGWFGKNEVCRIPTKKEMHKFLD